MSIVYRTKYFHQARCNQPSTVEYPIGVQLRFRSYPRRQRRNENSRQDIKHCNLILDLFKHPVSDFHGNNGVHYIKMKPFASIDSDSTVCRDLANLAMTALTTTLDAVLKRFGLGYFCIEWNGAVCYSRLRLNLQASISQNLNPCAFGIERRPVS